MTILPLSTELEVLDSRLESYRRKRRPTTGYRSIDEMLDCIHEHVFDPEFDVATLRRLCRVRDNNHSSRFRRVTGVTPRAYIERLRLGAAVALLRDYPETHVLDVSYLVGYEHPQTFYRAFRRRYGMPPGEIRSSIGGD